MVSGWVVVVDGMAVLLTFVQPGHTLLIRTPFVRYHTNGTVANNIEQNWWDGGMELSTYSGRVGCEWWDGGMVLSTYPGRVGCEWWDGGPGAVNLPRQGGM